MPATRDLAQFVVETDASKLPQWTLHEAARCFVNYLGAALYASQDPSLDILISLCREEGGLPRATVVGTEFRTSLTNAAFINGYLAHLEDFDDTHFPTVLHGSTPVYGGLFALAEDRHVPGREFLSAFVFGFETAARVALSVHPWHYDQGWHVTGTAGVFGAAASAGRVLKLDTEQMLHALGTSGTQASSIREVLGSMCKPMHPAKAACNGLQAAMLASKGWTSSQTILEGRRGFWHVFSPQHNAGALTQGLGERWELAQNGLKPYACGVVAHPLIDAMLELRKQGVRPADIERIEARVHPLVLELMNRPAPRIGLETKFSVQHAASAALADGACYPQQFTDAKALNPVIAALRQRIHLTPTEGIDQDQVEVTVRLAGGRVVTHYIEHATGSPGHPMTDAELDGKFRSLAGAVLSPSQVERLAQAAWTVGTAPDVAAVAALCTRHREAAR